MGVNKMVYNKQKVELMFIFMTLCLLGAGALMWIYLGYVYNI